MRVFVTGGTGTIGGPVVAELLGHGHTVLALARSDRSADALKRAGAMRYPASAARRRSRARVRMMSSSFCTVAAWTGAATHCPP